MKTKQKQSSVLIPGELYMKAKALKEKKEFVRAIEIYANILDQPSEKQDESAARVYEDLGDIYFALKDFENAFTYMEKALHIYAELKNHDQQLAQYLKIGGLQQGIWQFKKAIELFQQGLALSGRLKKAEKIVEFELALGNVYNWADQHAESEKYLLSAIKKESVLNVPITKLKAHLSYAILMRKMKRFDEAVKYFNLAMQLSSENANAYRMDIAKSYGILQYEMGNYDLAEPLLLDAEQKAGEEGNDAIRAVIFEYLAQVYEYKKDYEKAYRYIRKFFDRKLELLERGYSEENNILTAKIGLEDAKRARTVAEDMADAKSLFIATISHEIRTPMNIILGTTGLMLNDKPKKEHVRYLQTLKRSGENLLGIINDILDISKIEAGRLEIEFEPVNLADIFENCFMVLEQSALEKQLRLTYKVDPKINHHVLSDPLRLSQIIINLVGNAIKFTEAGKIDFSVSRKDKQTMQLTISDTGMGISPEKLETLFDEYEQVRTEVHKKYKGTGLGLSISKKLVELMNGTITVKSKENSGTTFTILLPLKKAEAADSKETAAGPHKSKFLDGKTILVADDLEDNCMLIRDTLQFFNKSVKVIEAENGKAAIDLLKKKPADLVIMDLDMPVLNGFEALAAIRKESKLKNTLVIASTASLVTGSAQEFKEMGFDAYLPKPFDMNSFHALLASLLTKRK